MSFPLLVVRFLHEPGGNPPNVSVRIRDSALPIVVRHIHGIEYLRGAIRKGYQALLCELSDRKVIGLARHKTNRDYLRDLRKRTDIIENVGGMTSNYERSWYGLRAAKAEDWEEFRVRYHETIGAVK